MKFLLRFIISLIAIAALTFVLLLVTIWWLGNQVMQDTPELTQFPAASLDDIKRIKQLAINASTRRLDSDEQEIVLSARDINLGIGYFGPTQIKIPKDSYARATIKDDRISTLVTFPAALLAQHKNQLPTNIPGWARHTLDYAITFGEAKWKDKWINLHWQFAIDNLAKKGQWVSPGLIRIGELTLTQNLSDIVAGQLYQFFLTQPSAKTVRDSWSNITGLDITQNELHIKFNLPHANQAIASYQSLVFSNDDQIKIQRYLDFLHTLPQSGPLHKVVAQLFTQVIEESNRSLDPVVENRTALLALAKRYRGDKLLQMLNASAGNIALRQTPRPYTLYNRKDLAQHYVLSAGLSLMANEDIAELIGLDKEIADLNSGRTISAWDLLADKAGARLAQNATHSARSARKLQIALSEASRDSHLLPDLARQFEFAEDRFGVDEIEELNVLIELVMENHPLLEKSA